MSARERKRHKPDPTMPSARRVGGLLGRSFVFGWLITLIIASSSAAATPPDMADSRRFVAARFEGTTPQQDTEPGLVVLANHDPVQKNARAGRPLNIAGAQHTLGLFCHAPSRILVRLPSPGESFSAVVGIDSNEQTSGGRGSVDFSVTVSGAEKFRSGVMREGTAGKAVAADLGGATEFMLQIEQTSDGIACDQADWAEAKVKLRDGRELWLADLPIREALDQRLFASVPPFSFTCGGIKSTELLKQWECQRTEGKLDAQRTERTVAYTDRATGLQLRCVAIEYHDFPTVEWTVYLKNTGSADTPIIESIQALDVNFDRASTGEFLLHHNVGSPANGNDYGPLETPLPSKATKRIGGSGGRPTNADWSYFNLEAAGQGWIVAVGWPGQWSAEFTRDAARGLHVRAGQEITRFKLHPGEEVRSPLIVIQFWKGGDWLGAQNVWRRWMVAHNVPRPGGQLPPPQLLAASSRQYDEMIKANTENQILFVNRYLEEGLKLDYWWMDAGWYVHHGGGWPRVGTWQVDTNRFPRGLRAVSDHAHSKGVKILVWFEPERVTAGTWLAENHPEWILGGARGGLLNLGNDAARRWLTDHVDALLTSEGIDLYRQDFNIDPIELWRSTDRPERQGITEIKYVTGYLAYWDELRRRHPNMLIDSCASGGRRNDIETMRRAVPLWRSDYAYEAIGHQCMTYGLSLWLPFHGTGTVATRNASYYGSGPTPVEDYAFWSNASQLSLGLGMDMREKLDYPALRRLVKHWRDISPNYYGDFHPLTPWTRDEKAWMAWQFDRPEAGTGVVQVFRRHNSFYESARFKLRGLDASARYEIINVDEPASRREITGKELMEAGLLVPVPEQPGVAVITYSRLK